jgi:hypothetical protein
MIPDYQDPPLLYPLSPKLDTIGRYLPSPAEIIDKKIQ